MRSTSLFLVPLLVFTKKTSRLDLPPYRINISLIDDVTLVLVCLRDDLILAFLLQHLRRKTGELASTITNYCLNILRLYDVVTNVPFITSETMLNYYS